MPSRPMKRSRSGDGQLDRPLVSALVFETSSEVHPCILQKRVSLAPVNNTDVLPPRPVFHTVLPAVDFPQQKPTIACVDGYSMTPLWEPRPQNDTTPQSSPSHGGQIDDGDVVSLISAVHVLESLIISQRMDCDTTLKRSASPSASPLSSTDPPRDSSNPSNVEGLPLRTPQPLTNCPSTEMNEALPPVSQGPLSQVTLSSQPKRPRFTMGPRSDCEKCRAGVKGHWGHFT